MCTHRLQREKFEKLGIDRVRSDISDGGNKKKGDTFIKFVPGSEVREGKTCQLIRDG